MARQPFETEEEKRLRLEAERIAREQQEKVEAEAAAKAKEAEDNANRAAEEAQAEAENDAKASNPTIQQDQVESTTGAPINSVAPEAPTPEHSGIRSTGYGRLSAEDRQTVAYARAVNEALDDTRFKVKNYNTAEGYDASKGKAHFKKQMTAFALGTPLEETVGNKVSVDYRSIRDKNQAFALLMTYSDDAAKVKAAKKMAPNLNMTAEMFLAEAENYIYDKFGRNAYSSPYSSAAKNRAYTGKLSNIGLTDVDGSVLDIMTASTADVIRASRMDPNPATANSVYDVVKEMTKVKGNPWYGMTVTKDMFKFVESAELDAQTYKDDVDTFNAAFTYSKGYTQENKDTYDKLLADIKSSYSDNPRVLGYMVRELNKSYTDHTGVSPQTQAPVKLGEQPVQTEESKEPEEEGADGKEVTATVEELLEKAKAQKSSGGTSVIGGGGTVSVNGQEVEMSKPIASTGMPPMSDLFPEEETAETFGPEPKKDYKESKPYDPNMTAQQAWMFDRAGYELDPRNSELIARYANPEISGLFYDQAAAYQAGTPGSSSHLNNSAVSSYRKHGHFLGRLAQDIAASDLQGEDRALAELAVANLAADIYDMWADPSYGLKRKPGENMYDHMFEFEGGVTIPGGDGVRTFLDEYYSIQDSIKAANGSYSENVVSEAEERAARIDGYVQTIASGNGTPEMLDAVSDFYSQDWVDVEADDWRNELVGSLNGRNAYFSEDSTFWQGDSMAAVEGRNIRTAGGMQGFYNFSDDLKQRTEDIIDSYTTAAHNVGMTLKEYLGSAGITNMDQIAGIAYNDIQMQGKALLEDKELQAAIGAANENPVGVTDLVFGKERVSGVEAVGLGAQIGVEDYLEGFAQTSYMAMDAVTYEATRQSIRDDYLKKYGEDAAEMYRRDLNAMIDSGALSPEMVAELQKNMERAYSIFDVAYEIDPDGLKGFLRMSRAELGKHVELLQTVKGMLEPDQQKLVDTVSSGAGSLTGMAINAVTMKIGSLARLAPIASRITGAVLGTGFNSFEDAYDENFHTGGMRKGTAAKAAFFESGAMTLIEYCTPDSVTGWFFGDASIDGMNRAARKNLPSLGRAMFGYWMKNLPQEGFEEGLQTTAKALFDIADAEWQAYDRGEGFSTSRLLKTMENGLKETDYVALGKEVLTSFGAGVAMGAVFNLVGVAGAGGAALVDARNFKKYESVNLAVQMSEGSIEMTDENVGKLFAAMKNDLNDPKYCKYIDKMNMQQIKSRQVMTAMMEGTEANLLYAAMDKSARAKEYGDKADAAGKAVDSSKGSYMSLRELVASGDLAKVNELEKARMLWQKAETAYSEAKNAEANAKEAAARDAKSWLKACQERGSVLTAEGMKVRMNNIANLRMGLAKRLDTLYSAMENAQANYEDAKRRDDIVNEEVAYAENAVFGEEAEIDEEIAAMDDAELDTDIEGMNAQIADAEARVADVSSRQEELGIGGDTVQALVEQEIAPLSKRKERIIAREKGRFNDAFDRMQQALEMDNEDAANEIQTEYDGIAARLQTLGVDTDALIAEQYGVAPEEANAAYEAAQEQEAQRAEDEKYGKLTDDLSRRMEATNGKLEAINPARWYFMKNPIYVNNSQATDILAADGLKSISQFNRRYGTKLTTKETDGAMPLDGHVLSDISSEAAGSVRVDGDPVAEMLTVLHTGKELAATQKEEKAEAKTLAEERKRVESARRERVTDVVTGTTKEQREQAKTEEQAKANIDAMDVETFIEQNHKNASEEEKTTIRKAWEKIRSRTPMKITADITQFAARVEKKFGVKIRFVDSLDGIARGKITGNEVVVAKDATAGDVVRAVIVHELTHKAEGAGRLYDRLSGMILDMKYGGDKAAMEKDIAQKIADYTAYNKTEGEFGDTEAKQEIVADYLGEIVNGNESLIERLVRDDYTLAQKVSNIIHDVIDKFAGVKDKQLAQMKKAVRTLDKAIRKADKTGAVDTRTRNQINPGTPTETVVFDSRQIKSADKNIGLFDPNNPHTKYSLPSQNALENQILEWMQAHQEEMDKAAKDEGVSQQPDTLNRNPYLDEKVKEVFDTNPIFRSYKKDTNKAQLNRALGNIRKNGYAEEVERLLDADHLTVDESVEIDALTIAAFEQGDIAAGFNLAAKRELNQREAARTLQASSIFAKMSPSHVMAKIAGKAEVTLSDIEATYGELASEVKRVSKENGVKLRDLKGGDAIEKANQSGEFSLDEYDRKFGVPTNEKQRALIKMKNLENVKRPGLNYNRATVEQRMLEAILQTPDPDADIGNGRTLLEILEWMEKGKPVVTVADLRYIAARVADHVKYSAINKDSRDARVALSRALEAYGNTTPATLSQKIRTQRFVNMLLSIPSSLRNFTGNAGQNAETLAVRSTIGATVDYFVGKFTGERYILPPDRKEMVAGWDGFWGGLSEAFLDSFVDKTNAATVSVNDVKFNESDKGRVFQKIPLVGGIPIVGNFFADLPENARHLESFLMSWGDKSVYKAAYAASISEQTALAQKNNVDVNWDEVVKQAKADADYAVFNESSDLRKWLKEGRQRSALARFFMDLYTPFIGIPLNIAKRGFYEFSPVGAFVTAVQAVADKATGKNFNQQRFVDGVSKGLGGSVMMILGAALAKDGLFYPGTGEEDDEKLYNLRAAMGEQYSPFIKCGDEYVSLSWAAPWIYPITLGATVYNILKGENESAADAVFNAGTALLNQFFDASFMSGLADLFDTSGSSFGENLLTTIPSTLMSQLLPYGTFMGQWANASDQYVRDTKDASTIREAFNKAVINRLPEAREYLLPTKNDITGNPFESKEGIRNFVDPFNTTKVNDDPALVEMDRLYDELGSSSHIPTYLVKKSGKVTILASIADNRLVNMDRANGENNLVLTAKERNHYNQLYSTLCFEGTGDERYKGIGKVDTRFDGIREVMASRKYQRASDEEKAKMISEILSKAKQLTQAQIVIDKGYLK